MGHTPQANETPAKGRRVQLHPQEALLQEARALLQSAGFAGYR